MHDVVGSYVLFLIVLVALMIIALVLVFLYQHKKEMEIRESVFSGKFIPVEEFERNWLLGGSRGKSGFAGYKYEDQPGCYVILMFSHEVEGDDWGSYDDVYIGQSVKMCSRVHSHFNGKGNGDVYADVRNGKHVYVQLRPCDKEQMNELEKSLIAAFHATNSYNKTRGGSTQR